MDWLFNFIKDLVANKFTGSLQINFYLGGISNVNKSESVKPITKGLTLKDIVKFNKVTKAVTQKEIDDAIADVCKKATTL